MFFSIRWRHIRPVRATPEPEAEVSLALGGALALHELKDGDGDAIEQHGDDGQTPGVTKLLFHRGVGSKGPVELGGKDDDGDEIADG